MNENDYDEDGNNIVPCPICLDTFCPSKEGGKCPKEDEFARDMTNNMSIEKTVRDICSVSVAPAAKSAVRRIIKEHDTQTRIDTLKEVEEWAIKLQEEEIKHYGTDKHGISLKQILTHIQSLLDKKEKTCCGRLGLFGKCGRGTKKGCTGAHCRCMGKDCQNMHYVDCFEHYIHVED